MIIKNYVQVHGGPTTELTIWEDATDVVVYDNLWSGRDRGPDVLGDKSPVLHLTWASYDPNLYFKFIDFTAAGVRCRLRVEYKAYVCNNDGRTIEKIEV